MRTPAPGELLDAWDLGAAQPSVQCTQPLLTAMTGLSPEQVEALGVSTRDRLLVGVRELLFGATIRTVLPCPTCGLPLEVTLATSTLLAAGVGSEVVETDIDGYRVRCREPRVGDLVDAAGLTTAAGARTLLVERSVLSAELDGAPVAAAVLPDPVVAAAADAVARAHPLAGVELPICCDACGEHWVRPFDIGAFLWAELDAWAVRLLGEVHLLAVAYGWSEPEILALSATRRRRYLELVGHD